MFILLIYFQEEKISIKSGKKMGIPCSFILLDVNYVLKIVLFADRWISK